MNAIPAAKGVSLGKFADLLAPTDEYIAHGQKLVGKVIEAIRENQKYSVDRAIYAGSIGKATEIMDADFDVVVFLNDSKPPFDQTLADWENILGMNENLKVDADSVRLSRYSVQFLFYDTGIEVDLLPATNLVKGDPKPGGATLAEVQKNEVMKLIDAKNHQEYSSSVAETQIYLLKQQGSLAHQAIRLAKFWLKSLYFGHERRRPYGIKTMIELIAVAAAMEEDRRDRDNQSLLRTFVKFLDDVKRIDELKLAFEKNKAGRWTAVNGQHCGVIDPGNPYNNLLDNLKDYPQYLNNLKKFAGITRERIYPCMVLGKMEPIYDLFCPIRIDFPFPRTSTLGSGDQNYQEHVPSEKVNNEKVFDKNPMVRRDIDVVKNFLLITANSIAVTAETLLDVRNKLNEMIDIKLRGQNHTPWVPMTKAHEDYDVTFTVPITTRPGLGAVKYSFTWL